MRYRVVINERETVAQVADLDIAVKIQKKYWKITNVYDCVIEYNDPTNGWKKIG